MPNFPELIDCLAGARSLVERKHNDFSWSSWEDADAALVEIDAILGSLRGGQLPSTLHVVFLPTGPLQELALSSGWSDDFIRLANWFEFATAGIECHCFLAPISGPEAAVGMDRFYGELSTISCEECGTRWIKYLYELEAFSRSGRWFQGPLPPPMWEDCKAESARELFCALPWYFVGGSFFDGANSKMRGPLPL